MASSFVNQQSSFSGVRKSWKQDVRDAILEREWGGREHWSRKQGTREEVREVGMESTRHVDCGLLEMKEGVAGQCGAEQSEARDTILCPSWGGNLQCSVCACPDIFPLPRLYSIFSPCPLSSSHSPASFPSLCQVLTLAIMIRWQSMRSSAHRLPAVKSRTRVLSLIRSVALMTVWHFWITLHDLR